MDDSENSPHEIRPCCVVCAVVDSEDLPCSLLDMADEDLSGIFHLSCLPDVGGIHAGLLEEEAEEECDGQERRKFCCRTGNADQDSGHHCPLDNMDHPQTDIEEGRGVGVRKSCLVY